MDGEEEGEGEEDEEEDEEEEEEEEAADAAALAMSRLVTGTTCRPPGGGRVQVPSSARKKIARKGESYF